MNMFPAPAREGMHGKQMHVPLRNERAPSLAATDGQDPTLISRRGPLLDSGSDVDAEWRHGLSDDSLGMPEADSSETALWKDSEVRLIAESRPSSEVSARWASRRPLADEGEGGVVRETVMRSPAVLQDDLVREQASLIALGDAALRVGDLPGAVRSYHRSVALGDGMLSPELMLRLGLAAEGTGAFTRALNLYRELQSFTDDSRWKRIAELGQARCLSLQNQSSVIVADLLPRVLLSRSHPSSGSEDDLLSLAVHHWAQSQMPRGPSVLVNDSLLTVPAWRAHVAEHLDRAEQLLSESLAPPILPGLRICRRTSALPEGIWIQAALREQPVESLLQQLSELGGWHCQFSRSAREALERRLSIAVEELPLYLAWDGICLAADLDWTLEEATVHVRTLEESGSQEQTQRLFQMERLLKYLLEKCPHHPLAPVNQMALAAIVSQRGRWSEAANLLQEVVHGRAAGQWRAAAAFNLGKCRLVAGDAAEALAAFQLCIDTHQGDHQLLAAAYLYVARLKLATDEYRQSVHAAARALAYSEPGLLHSTAVELLTVGYLLGGNPYSTNATLLKYREGVAPGLEQDRFAFLDAYARAIARSDQKRGHVDMERLLEATTHLDPASAFGDHWWLLKARAYRDVGLRESAAEVLQEACARRLPPEISARLKAEWEQVSSADSSFPAMDHAGGNR